MIGCMNRGGLSKCVFEMDDRFTAFTAEKIFEMRLDGAKLMFRLEPNETASGDTIHYCSNAINELNDYDVPVFLECLPVEKTDDGYKVRKNFSDLVKTVGVATGLGYSSKNLWLKIPYCDDFEIVAKSTTCPILMLGGASREDPTGVMKEFRQGMDSGKNVRGVLVGRNVTFPGKDDPYAVSSAIMRIVHDACSVEEALDCLAKGRGKNMDVLSKLF